jgi:hypothetical protein
VFVLAHPVRYTGNMDDRKNGFAARARVAWLSLRTKLHGFRVSGNRDGHHHCIPSRGVSCVEPMEIWSLPDESRISGLFTFPLKYLNQWSFLQCIGLLHTHSDDVNLRVKQEKRNPREQWHMKLAWNTEIRTSAWTLENLLRTQLRMQLQWSLQASLL